MTFTELLDLDKTLLRPPRVSRANVPGKIRIDRTRYQATHHDTVTHTTAPSKEATVVSQHHGTKTSRHHATMTPALLRQLRQAVHRIGKEAATYRFTREEKDGLAEVIYRQSKAGTKACENEIVRIGVNWLLQDYRSKGEKSLLALVLRALRE